MAQGRVRRKDGDTQPQAEEVYCPGARGRETGDRLEPEREA